MTQEQTTPHPRNNCGNPDATRAAQLRAQLETYDQEFMLAKEGGDEAHADTLGRAMARIQQALDALWSEY